MSRAGCVKPGRIMGIAGLSILTVLPMLVSAASLESVFAQISSSAAHSGRFVQTKKLQGLSFPILSEGRFAFVKNLGLYNEVQKPLFQAVSYSANGITEWDKDAQPLIKSSNNMVERHVSEMLLAFFGGDEEHIKTIFSINESTSSESRPGWSLMLKPKQAAMKKYIRQIEIQGEEYIHKITVSSENGDVTEIRFFDLVEINDFTEYCRFFPKASLSACQF